MAIIQMISPISNINPLPAFPVGYIYISFDSTSPASMFGGSWTQITNAFLLGAGSTYSNGATGGATTVTLTTANLPAHRHSATAYGNSSNSTTNTNWEYASGYTTPFPSYTNATGGGVAHNNMPPYFTVYAWKKTAQ